MNQIVIMTNNR